MKETLLRLESVSLQIYSKDILQPISLHVKRGEVKALIGRNGAGKSTIIRICAGLIKPTEGKVFLPKPSKIGYLPEERGVYKSSTVYENLNFFHQLFTGKTIDKQTVNHLCEIANFQSILLNRKPESMSKGQQQKLQWLIAICHQPDVLILDEPFSGYDPDNSLWLINEINRLKSDGKAILISSHRLDFLGQLTDHVYCVNKGKIVDEGSYAFLFEKLEKGRFEIEVSGELRARASVNIELAKETHNGHWYLVSFKGDENENSQVRELIRENQEQLIRFCPKKRNIADVFNEIMPI